ncbi:MAG: hypothetical protein WA001_04750 [Patescibacteria group bacterium]
MTFLYPLCACIFLIAMSIRIFLPDRVIITKRKEKRWDKAPREVVHVHHYEQLPPAPEPMPAFAPAPVRATHERVREPQRVAARTTYAQLPSGPPIKITVQPHRS